MASKILNATHAGEIKIGEVKISCAVLEDQRRVLTQKELCIAIGRSVQYAKYTLPKPIQKENHEIQTEAKIPIFLAAKNIVPFISDRLISLLYPIKFKYRNAQGSGPGRASLGYPAEVLPEICSTFLDARSAGALTPKQLITAHECEIAMRAFATLGIIALVDEVTGYQKVRARDALHKILEEFIAKELQPWIQTFPSDFYEEMFRLKGWKYDPGKVKRPSVVGHYTNDLIYARLAPGVLEELRKRNPRNDHGYRKNKHFQHLTIDKGHPKLREHISQVLVLMRAATDWDHFYYLINRAIPAFDGRAIQKLLEFDDPFRD